MPRRRHLLKELVPFLRQGTSRRRLTVQQTSRQRQSSWITTPQAPQPATMGAHQDVMPPEYEYDRRQSQDSDLVSLPSYREDEEPVRVKGQEKHAEQRAGPSTSVANRLSANGIRRAEGGTDDKMLRELDDVTGAIERLLSVSPALEDQRVSLPAQSTGQSSSTARRREISQRMDRAKMSELEELWDKIEAAHGKGRSHADGQRADLSEWERRKEERRTRFLEGLLDHGEAGRLAGQDSPRGVVNGQDETARAQKQAAFMDDVAARSRAGRLSEQEYPTSMEDRLEQRRQRLIDSILDFSSSGRLNDQDSAPPTPRAVRADLAAEDSGEEVTLDEYIRTSQSGSSRMGRRDSAISLSSQKSAKGGSRSRSGSGGNLLDEGRKSPAPFKKLAGLVRKSSSGLNLRLPTPGSLDSGSIAYVAEYQENLRVVHVIVHGPGVAANPDLVLETDDEARQARIISKRDANFAATINLPCRVVAQQSVAPRTNELCLEAKLAAQPAATISSTSINSVITHAMDANELTRSSTRMFHCQACDRPLADYGANLVAQDLPSEHWGEMMEAWMCHSDPSWTARLARMQDEGFWPKARQVLCGGSYLLVHGDSVERRNISVAQTKVSQILPLLSSAPSPFSPLPNGSTGYQEGRRHCSYWRSSPSACCGIGSCGSSCKYPPGRAKAGETGELDIDPYGLIWPIHKPKRETAGISNLSSARVQGQRDYFQADRHTSPKGADLTQIESGWTQINCVCGEAIGNQRAEDGKPGAGVVKLQKWAVYGAPADGAA